MRGASARTVNVQKVPAFTCPCGKLHEAATCPEDDEATPEEGHFSVCMECGRYLIFGEGLKLRPVTRAELLSAPRELQEKLALHRIGLALFRERRKQN